MISLAASKPSGRLLVLISAGVLLYANSSLAAEPVSDPQEQARQFIVAKPNFGIATDSKAHATAAVAAQANDRLDPQEQARQFIVAKPNFGVATDSKAHATAAVAAQDNDRLDPQEQARQFILAKPNFNGPAGRVGRPSKTKVMPTVSARSDRGGYSDSQ
jgi:hypothetical protein